MTLTQMHNEVRKNTHYWLQIGFGIPTLINPQLKDKNTLIQALLIEEYTEYLEATNRAEKLNAIADLLFVANNRHFFDGLRWESVQANEDILHFYNPQSVFTNYSSDYQLVISAINTLIKESGFSIYEVHQENERVFKSNMTKYCRSEEEAKISVEMYLNGTHHNKQGKSIECVYVETGNSEFPYRVTTPQGKIMKSHLFKDVNEF